MKITVREVKEEEARVMVHVSSDENGFVHQAYARAIWGPVAAQEVADHDVPEGMSSVEYQKGPRPAVLRKLVMDQLNENIRFFFSAIRGALVIDVDDE